MPGLTVMRRIHILLSGGADQTADKQSEYNYTADDTITITIDDVDYVYDK